MKKYRIFGTTADVGVVSSGISMEEAFEAQAAGMFAVMVDLRSVRPLVAFKVEAQGDGPERLLSSFLEELLFIFDSKQVFLKGFRIISLHGGKVTAEARGEEIDRARHVIKTPVKAVTHHMMEVREYKGRFRTKVVYDI